MTPFLQVVNAKHQDFGSELNIYAQTENIIDMFTKAGAGETLLNELKTFSGELKNRLTERYGITDEEIAEVTGEQEVL